MQTTNTSKSNRDNTHGPRHLLKLEEQSATGNSERKWPRANETVIISHKDNGSQDMAYIKKVLRGAWSNLHDTQRDTGILRSTYLEDLSQFKAATHGTTEAQKIKTLLHVEAVRNTAKNMVGTSRNICTGW